MIVLAARKLPWHKGVNLMKSRYFCLVGALTALALAGGRLEAQQGTPFDPPAPPPAAGETEPPAPSPEEAAAARAAAEKEFLEEVESYGWSRSGQGQLGEWAEVEVPSGYRFTTGDGARRLLQLYGNLVGDSELGLIAPENLDWFILFAFDERGYVKDDEKDQLDADEIFQQKKEQEKLGNEERQRRGLPRLYNEGWVVKPHYDEKTNNLEWGLKLRSESGGESVNYMVKLLGRKGVMDATLVCDPAQLDATLPLARRLIGGHHFQSGETYAEYRVGDKIAQGGLTALVIGGGAALAVKSGLWAVLAKFFGKFFKIILIGLVAVAAVFKKVFGGLFGGGKQHDDTFPPPPPPPPAS